MPRPNVLLVVADQLAAAALAPYGNRAVRAPHIAGLAERGVLFERAYCNYPLCSPSRASMLTGRLPSRLGVYDNAAEFPASYPTVAHHLRLAGYRTCLAGKMHFVGPDQLHGFEERVTTDVYPAGFGWTPDWDLPEGERLEWYHTAESVLEAAPRPWSLQLDFDEEVAFRARRRLYDLARDDDERPFFLTVGFTHPHDPWELPRSYWERYDAAAIDMPEVPSLPLDRMDPQTRRALQVSGLDTREISPEQVRVARHAYYAAVSYLDDKVGELLEVLQATGRSADTVVVLTSDHGDMRGERGLWYKMSFFEGSARVPLIVCAPDRFAPRRVAGNVSLVDLLPTLVELGEGEAQDTPVDPLDGDSLLPLLRGEEPRGPDTVCAEYLGEGVDRPSVMVRRGRFKLLHYEGEDDQLFDVVADPLELEDLAGRPEHAEVLADLRAEVAARWDLPRLRDDVRASQRRRRVVARALATGRPTRWDYVPPDDGAERFIHTGVEFWEQTQRGTFDT